MNCDIYLFCLWNKSKYYWKLIADKISDSYKIKMLGLSYFPESIQLLYKFYNNENLVGGYSKKLSDISGEFMFIVAVDELPNNFSKLYNFKKSIRDLSSIKDDYNFMHSSNNLDEFKRQINILEGFVWQSVTFI